jgi:hypothetical protein
MSKLQRTFFRSILMLLSSIALLALGIGPVAAAPGDVIVFAGPGTGQTGFAGDGSQVGPGTLFDHPFGVAVYGQSLYIADVGNNRIRKVDTSGIITTVVGDGTAGVNNGPLASGQVNLPLGVTVNAQGTLLYIADSSNNLLRKVDLVAGTIETETSIPSLILNGPWGVVVDSEGDVYIGSMGGNGIFKYDPIAETILPVYQMANPSGITIDQQGNVYSAGHAASQIYKIESVSPQWSIIAATAGANGSIVPPGVTTVTQGNDQAYTITPDVGYHIADVLVDGGSIGAVNTHVFNNLQADHTISASFATVGAAFYQPVDFSSFHNGEIQSELVNGGAYPLGSQVLGGIPFNIPTSGNNYWGAFNATGPNPRQIDIPVNRFGVSEVHTLINTFWGQAGLPSLASLEFFGSGGAHHVLNLIGNEDIRDQNNASYTNIINNTTTTEVFINGPGRLDKQFITLPAAFHNQVLTTIRVIDNGADGSQRLIVLGVSVGIANDVVVSMPAVTATYNQVLTIPVSISDASGLVAAELTVEYDTALLTLVGANSTGTLTDGWSIETNTVPGAGTLEQLVMAIATDQSSATGAQTLINLDFTVNDVRSPASSSLTLSGALLNDGNPPNVTLNGLVTLVGNDATIVFSSGGSPIPRESISVVVSDADADLTSGPGNDNVSVTITNLGNGDVINATLPEDGALAGTFSLVVPTEFGLAAVVDATIQAQAGDDIDFNYVDQLDANGNGPIPRTIVANAIGGTDGTIVSTIVSQPGDLVYIRVTDADLNTDDLLQESVVVTALSSTTESAGILSGDLLIEDLVGQVEMAPELSNFLSAWQVGQEGLHIVFAGAQEVSGPGELLRVYPGVGPDKAQLTRAHFNDGRIVGRVEAHATSVAVATTFALHANYPNPFNPETTIAFDLPQAGSVELQVFDLLGQTVRTLVAQELSAGTHQMLWRGVDDRGQQVSSGVYFYRLKAGGYTQMRRMLLLK